MQKLIIIFFLNCIVEKKARLLLILLSVLCTNIIAQVSNPRIPAEWEEIQAVVMEPLFLSRFQTDIPWELVVDPYIKVAQACIEESVDLYLLERQSHTYVNSVLGDGIIHLDTIFSNRGIISPKIHIIQINDTLAINAPWARDNGMYCVYENNVGHMNMYHFDKDYTSKVVDSFFNLNSEKIETTLHSNYTAGGNFMTDGHGTFNVMNDNDIGIVSDYLFFNKYFGIKKTAKYYFFYNYGHIDLSMKMINEETIILSSYRDYMIPFIKENLLSAFDREFKIIAIQNAPDFKSQSHYFNQENYATYTNALILNNTVLVPQYACYKFDYYPETDSLALEAYRKAMPGYNIIGVNCSAYQMGGGAIHCLTRDIPANNPIYIKHKWLADSIEYTNKDYEISALVQSSQGISDVKLFWRVNDKDIYTVQSMTLAETDTYTAGIPYQNIGTDVEYYITATDNNGKNISKPFVAPKGTYKSKIVKVGAITHPDSLYKQALFPCLPNGTAIQQATISINNTTLTTNLLTNDTIATIDLKPGKYPYTVSSAGIVGEYHGIVNVNNRYPDTVKVAVNPFEFTVTGQHGDVLAEAEITFQNYLPKIAPSTINYAFEGKHDYEIMHPALIDAVSGTIFINESTFGSNYLDHVQQEQVVLNLDFYKLFIFPSLPDGTTAFATSVKISNTTLASDPLSGDSIVNILLPLGEHQYTITSPHIIGEYIGTWQPGNSYTDTVTATINPIGFLKGAEITIDGLKYTTDDSDYIYAFEGSYVYRATHPAMVDTACNNLQVTENTHGGDYIDHIPREQDVLAQLTILVDGLPHAGEQFYKEKFPGMDYVIIPDDGKIYFANAGTYNYEITFDRSAFFDTLSVDIKRKYTLNLMKLVFNSNNMNCYMAVNEDTLSPARRYLSSLAHVEEYPYHTFYKKNSHEIPVFNGIVSPSNKMITQNIYVPTYTIVSGDSTILTNALLKTNLGNNTFVENDNSFGIVVKEDEDVSCTVSCEGYQDYFFVAHSDNETHTIVLTETAYHTITFIDWDDTLLSAQSVAHGSDAIAPDTPIRKGYTFTGWDVDFTAVMSDLTVTAQYTLPTGIKSMETNAILIYPNPAKNTVTITMNGDAVPPGTVSFINLAGKTVYETSNFISGQSIDISHLPKGIYFVKTGNKVQKIIKE